MTITDSGDRRADSHAEKQTTRPPTPDERERRYQAARAKHNRAVGERCEAAVAAWFVALGLNPHRIDQRPATKHEICPPDGKRPDILADVDGDDFMVDVKNHAPRPCGRFALREEEMARFEAFLRQPGLPPGLPLFLGFVPKGASPILHLVDWTRLTDPCELGGEPALGIHLEPGDVLGPVPQAYLDQAQAGLITDGKFVAGDFLPPVF